MPIKGVSQWLDNLFLKVARLALELVERGGEGEGLVEPGHGVGLVENYPKLPLDDLGAYDAVLS